ncbi:uncharacterized protein M421DRAFT_424912 [Didymella exigua CBS 183.55]|uniref:Uncharacterized protein n=1 Tax=Didymella exigua CBS 183.55 TaxID=1150837 RepID=A0A6A5R7W2_9PLEO|nr:uncharacterized protein M421DRAFT_424912 [Didymella exigua CBS 183.55]KAF1924271.1 hypothetical protein M421DRAFT_424912 [Didymella exigua CBS 183.55]
MLSIQPSSPKKHTPNLLPARINHNGRIPTTPHHWTPTTDEKGTRHVHFRGRHLHGTTLPLPATHTGAILLVTDKPAPPAPAKCLDEDADADGDGDMDEVPEDVKIAEQIGEFDELVVWGHGGTVDEGDMYIRGVREWIGFAASMHCDDEDGQGEGKLQTNGAEAS